MNREKVIKGLEQIVNDPFMKARADYWVLVCSDAIALLKEMQEQIDKLLEENASNAEIAEGLKELLKEQEAEIEKLNRFVNGFSRDAMPVVRCKDCKHREESVSPSWEAWCNRLHCGCDLDWFCADGERKNSE